MSLTKVTSSAITDSAITTAKIENGTIVNADINSSAAIAQSKLGLSIPTITGVTIQNSAGALIPSDTSLYFDIAGTNFTNPSTVELLNNSTNAATQATTVTYVSSTALRATASLAAGTYKIRVTRSDGLAGNSASAILTSSQAVAFSTSAGSLGTYIESVAISTITVAATSDSAITYAVQSGSLPGGLSLNTSNGQITGTPNAVSADTTSTFTIRATDAESQFADREFTITVTNIVIPQSLRLNPSDSPRLTRTPSSQGNPRTFTFSCWVKKSSNGIRQVLFGADIPSQANASYVRFTDDDTLQAYFDYGNNTLEANFNSVAKFRDPSAWYHVVWATDTSLSTEADRVKLYVNGVQITDFQSPDYISQNFGTDINQTHPHYVGTDTVGVGNDSSIDGYLAEAHFIDGQQLSPTQFGETGSNGRWKPKSYSGTYGTNGFHLNFSNSSDLGEDSSGNNNDYTATNLAAIDKVTDSPQNNFATLNSVDNYRANSTFSEGNCKMVTAGSGYGYPRSTIGLSTGKWYFEAKASNLNGNLFVGIVSTANNGTEQEVGYHANDYGYKFTSGAIRTAGSETSYGNSISTSDILGVAIDLDNNKLYFSKNGTFQNSADPVSGSNGFSITAPGSTVVGQYFPTGSDINSSNSSTVEFNFGNPSFSITSGNADQNGEGNFEYAPPTGYLALCTNNLPEPTIKDSSAHFHTQLYTGNRQSTQTITNNANAGDFKPDWLWIKPRNDTVGHSHSLFDTVRGVTKGLASNLSEAEYTTSSAVTSFNTDGFSIANGASVNQPDRDVNYVAWQWKAGGSTPTNTYTVKVVSDSGNKYRFDDYGTSAITLELQEGGTYTFDQSDSSNSGHPLRFSTTADGTHGSGTEYTTGVTTTGTPGSAGAKTVITVAGSAATLYYYCSVHSGMGGQANTGSTHGFTNVDGSLQSVVSPNTTAGFSIVTWTGTEGNATVGHGIGKRPECIIVKTRGADENWVVRFKDTITGNAFHKLHLNNTNAIAQDNTLGNMQDTTSSVFYLQNSGQENDSGQPMIAYCFAPIEGYSKFGSYSGNGNANGTFVHTGFRPAWVLMKSTSAGNGWNVFDSVRGPLNPTNEQLQPNATSTGSAVDFDILSNGFKPRTTSTNWNGGSDTYVYMAFAESPFGGILTEEVTAR